MLNVLRLLISVDQCEIKGCEDFSQWILVTISEKQTMVRRVCSEHYNSLGFTKKDEAEMFEQILKLTLAGEAGDTPASSILFRQGG